MIGTIIALVLFVGSGVCAHDARASFRAGARDWSVKLPIAAGVGLAIAAIAILWITVGN